MKYLAVCVTLLAAAHSASANSCCDPKMEPGTPGNPIYFEGHRCCGVDGSWVGSIGDGKSFPCGGEIITEGFGKACDELEPEFQCKEDIHCPQPGCLADMYCPSYVCVEGQCVEEENQCKEDIHCPQPRCINCPSYICVEGQCVEEEPVGCPEDSKQCSDGSYVSRSGPGCEFDSCPPPYIKCKDTDDCPKVRCMYGAPGCPEYECDKDRGICIDLNDGKERSCCKDAQPSEMECGRSGCHCCGDGTWLLGNSGPTLTSEVACGELEPSKVCEPDQVVCTDDVQQCQDGTYVSRTGPDCQFAPCENQCKEDIHCPQPLCVQAPCPSYICVEGQCVAEIPEPEDQCKEDYNCPQPRCMQGVPCPSYICVDGQCVEEELEPEEQCKDDFNCPLPLCLPNGPCPSFICVEGKCVQPEPEEQCKEDVNCPQLDCLPDTHCPSFVCIQGQCVEEPEVAILCTADVKECEDGSYVNRSPDHNCEFSPCSAQTRFGPTDAHETPVGPTDDPDSPVDPTEAPETPVDPTEAPETLVDPTDAPETPVDPTEAPETPVDPTEAPETPVDPTDTSAPKPPKSGGDPHFKTWSNIKFDYHGECDLVLIDNPEFANGLGMRLHIRTTRVEYYSYIESIALQIGSDTLEFNNDLDNYLINGEKAAETGNKIGGFEVHRFHSALSVRLDNKKHGNSKAHIDFLYRKNGFPYVRPDGKATNLFEGSLGLLGEWSTGKMIGRNGETEISDATEFARQWQVRDTEPMLFSSARFPQFPAVCTPPKKMLGKRLGDSHMKEAAEKACASWKEDKEECVFDVMATRSMHSAEPVGRHAPTVSALSY